VIFGLKTQKKIKGKNKGNEISRFALRASLRPSAEQWPLRGWLKTRG